MYLTTVGRHVFNCSCGFVNRLSMAVDCHFKKTAASPST
jgi:hypothetical protein